MHSLKQCLQYRQFGAADGRLVVYFHGTPGAPEECAVFDPYGKEHDLTIICYDRSSIDFRLLGNAYYQRLADEISGTAAGQPVDFIGFSIGGFFALQVCRMMNNQVRSLHLVSAAAPLEVDNVIDLAVGKAVFQLARSHPAVFTGLARLQGLIAGVCPTLLFRMLFAGAAGADQALGADKAFRTMMTRTLKTGLGRRPQAYARDIQAYVRPWKETLADIYVNTSIWHGGEDNWSPLAMAVYLGSALPNASKLEILEGLSHYSCLYRCAPAICNSINQCLE